MVVGILHLILFIISVFIFLPKHLRTQPLQKSISNIFSQFHWFLLILAVVIVHLIEVNVLDPWSTQFVGTDYATVFKAIEDSIVANMYHLWNIIPLGFFVIMYIVVYPFILWFSNLYFLIDNQKKALQSLAFSLVPLYILSLPFYLFLPVSNVYTYYDLDSSLSLIFPSINLFFYTTTTANNCFPSLHVAMSILITWAVKHTNNKPYYYFTLFSMLSVIISVMYLAIHWIIDVIGGILVASAAIIISNTVLKRISSYEQE